jgi:Asp-tRNA(Asn)/Glu-tRNA(Gln) amidotransferase C subunit
MDREAQRAEYAAELRAAAERRFGAARAEALAKTIEDIAGWMAEVSAFPVAADEPPAFYAEPAP